MPGVQTGFVGAVTGFSPLVSLSEKVWEVYDSSGGLQPGSYQGLPVVGLIRNLLQFGADLRSAAALADAAERTWAVFLGVGSAADNAFEALAYREKCVAQDTCFLGPSSPVSSL